MHSRWPFGSTRPSSLPGWLAGALSAPPPAVGLPGNGGLERSAQWLSDSGCRLADDLLAGLESSEPRQLKWSLKLEPTFREGGGACTELHRGDTQADCVNSRGT